MMQYSSDIRPQLHKSVQSHGPISEGVYVMSIGYTIAHPIFDILLWICKAQSHFLKVRWWEREGGGSINIKNVGAHHSCANKKILRPRSSRTPLHQF